MADSGEAVSVVVAGFAVAATIAGLVLLKRYFAGEACHSNTRLNGKTVVITGANTGIGKETAVDLARRNARVIMACRDEQRGREACNEVKRLSGNENVQFSKLDLADLQSVRKFAAQVLEQEPRIDILINNAGVCYCPFMKTRDGFEMHFGVNHLGHFLLTLLLLDRLKESSPSRIISVSAKAYAAGTINFDDLQGERRYGRVSAYCQSKLANLLFTTRLAKRLEGTGVTVYSLHPGVIVSSEIGRHLFAYRLMSAFAFLFYPFIWFVTKSLRQGAQTTIYCAVAEELEGISGRYYSDCAEATLMSHATDDGVAKKLWEVSEVLTGFLGHEVPDQ